MRPNKDTGSSSSIPNLRKKSLLVVVIILIIDVIILIIDVIIVSVSVGVTGSANRNLVYNLEVCRYEDEVIEFLEHQEKRMQKFPKKRKFLGEPGGKWKIVSFDRVEEHGE